ncbi:hypothetical protein N0754_19265 [Pseudomonas aeruginosa]|nr:hypothetical protein [Pseudomonas aeruginosa]MCS9764376.1 hypothetical protein [Pseudomonas aeruginosa]MCS9822416.1 hypothetical protein [Pseudomonas aeruginosa]MCT0241133.1 hypothetical protein [Pseudomonas aeruginosa]MCT0529981.1 hypothetical protein [Pseudomonas aeruginosa]
MRTTKSKELSKKIACDYAVWTVMSAFRQGPVGVRKRQVVQEMLRVVDFATVLNESKGPITSAEFSAWHAASVVAIVGTAGMDDEYGWAAKALNVYLKTTSYVGGLGRKGLVSLLHPPIDSGLWRGLRRRFAGNPALTAIDHYKTIRSIRTPESYAAIINGMRLLAQADNCLLIELEQYWLNAL